MAPRSSLADRGGPSARTPALMRTGVRVLTHPQGVRLDGHLLRGGAATRTVDHCTSPPFVPANRTRAVSSARAAMRRSPPPVRPRPPQAPSPRRCPPSTSSARSSVGSVPAGTGVGRSPTTSGLSPTPWIQRLFGVSHFAIVSRNAPPSPVSSCHCWTVPLPYDCWPTSVARPVSCRAPATISLADALPPSMRHDDADRRIRRHAAGRGRRSGSGSLRRPARRRSAPSR